MTELFGCAIVALVPIVGLTLLFLVSAVKVVPEYQRLVVFRLGRLKGARGPGLVIIIPIVERVTRVDLRTVTLNIEPQKVITKDNVTLQVQAVAYYHVVDPVKAVIEILNFNYAVVQIAQTTLRSVLGGSTLDELLAERDPTNERLKVVIDQQTEPWGVQVTIVEVKDVLLPENMERAMAKEAEAEREKRAKSIHAEGEFQASKRLSEASVVMEAHPAAMQLRLLQTLTEVAVEKNSTIVFPVPIDFISQFIKGMGLMRPGGGG